LRSVSKRIVHSGGNGKVFIRRLGHGVPAGHVSPGFQCGQAVQIQQKERPLQVGRGRIEQVIGQRGLPAKTFMSTVKMPVAIKVRLAATVESAVIADCVSAAPENRAIPESRHPIAVGHVAGGPDIAGAGARRDISYRSAYSKSKFGCLCRRRSESGHSSHHCCTQDPIPHVAHNPFLPPASLDEVRLEPGPDSFLAKACLLRPLRRSGYVLIQQRLRENVASSFENKQAQLSPESGFMADFCARFPALCSLGGTLNLHPQCSQLHSTRTSSESAASA